VGDLTFFNTINFENNTGKYFFELSALDLGLIIDNVNYFSVFL
jgi:hypothetical protein